MATQHISLSPDPSLHSTSIHDWQSAYSAALLEVQPCKLLTLIKIVEDAMFGRLRQMGDSPEERKERQLMFDAQAMLQFLRLDAQKTLFRSYSLRAS